MDRTAAFSAYLFNERSRFMVAAVVSKPLSLPCQFAASDPIFFRKKFSPRALPFLDLAQPTLSKGLPRFSVAPLFAKKAILNTVLGRSFGIAAAAGLGSGLAWLVHQVPNMHNWSGPADALVKIAVPAVLSGAIAGGLDNDCSNPAEEKDYKFTHRAIISSAFIASVLGAWLHATGKHSDPFDFSFVATASLVGISMLLGPLMRYSGVKKAIHEFDRQFVTGPGAEANVKRVLDQDPELRGVYKTVYAESDLS